MTERDMQNIEGATARGGTPTPHQPQLFKATP